MEAAMRSYALNEARSDFSKVFDRALSGEPQRITRYGKEAVVLVSEAEWNARQPAKATLADILLKYAGDGDGDELFGQSHLGHIRPLGAGFNDGDWNIETAP
jgi:prevent-host-death family protein